MRVALHALIDATALKEIRWIDFQGRPEGWKNSLIVFSRPSTGLNFHRLLRPHHAADHRVRVIPVRHSVFAERARGLP